MALISPLLLAGGAAVAAASTSAAQAANCSPTDADIDGKAVAKQVAAVLDGKGSAADVKAAGLEVPEEQVPNAKVIVATGISLGVPERGQVVALATAIQESRLRNLAYGDRDSLGLFQQRPSQGWGSAEQVRDPVHASTKFYNALMSTSGWQQMTIAQAAQAVQKSAFPGAYAQWEDLARSLQHAIAQVMPQQKTSSQPAAATASSACAPGSGGGKLPAGYRVPADAPRQVRTAIRWGLGQLGTPYQWGGTCQDAHGPDPMGRCDCSSLMQAAYAAAGVELTRTTYTQAHEGRQVSVGSLKPGDLLFTRGSAARPEHVGMYLGDGLVLNAPKTGEKVRLEQAAAWKPDVLTVRRIVPN